MVQTAKKLAEQIKESQLNQQITEETQKGRWDELINRIRDGETVGDRYQTYCAYRFHSFDPRTIQFYRDLDASVLAHPGELVLLIERELDKDEALSTEGGCFGGGDVYELKEMFSFGVLSGEKLALPLNDDYFALPTTRFISSEKRDNEFVVNDGAMTTFSFSFGYAPHLNVLERVSAPPHSMYWIFEKEPPALEIIIGNAAVLTRWHELARMHKRIELPRHSREYEMMMWQVRQIAQILNVVLPPFEPFEELRDKKRAELRQAIGARAAKLRQAMQEAERDRAEFEKQMAQLGMVSCEEAYEFEKLLRGLK